MITYSVKPPLIFSGYAPDMGSNQAEVQSQNYTKIAFVHAYTQVNIYHIYDHVFCAVCNKWIHERGQEFRRPCDLNKDL